MCNVLCVTNRSLCREDFLVRIEKIASAHPSGIILREKYLTPDAYKELAADVLAICKKHGTLCVLHGFAAVAEELNSKALHLPLHLLRELPDEKKAGFTILGASCHSAEDAIEAEKLGCTYITAGHIFDTDCKKGSPGRGIAFLQNVCKSVSIPVYAIGGITSEAVTCVQEAGASGVCVMSGAMLCEDVQKYLGEFK